jgi:ornithine cyclodeaminase/alanine dehydrogenase-like protein (mu-crystallin family)
MSAPILWITEQEVVSLVALDEAIDALERGLKSLGQRKAFNVPKALGGYGDGASMHSLGSGAPDLGYVGFKSWVHTKRGATALYTMFNAADGSVAAVIEAVALGQMRTAAMTGVGTRWLADPKADEMALIGTGVQSTAQVAAIHAVRPLRRVRVWSPTPEKRRAFVEQLAQQFEFDVIEVPTLESATQGAPIVTLVTRAREPFLSARHLAKGAHLNAVGAILPANAEFTQDVFDRVGIIAVDDVVNARQASRELIERFGTNEDGWTAVQPIGEVIAQGTGRPGGCDISLFKAMGMGVSDLSVAITVLERARANGVGRSVPHPTRATPRWNAAAVRA